MYSLIKSKIKKLFAPRLNINDIIEITDKGGLITVEVKKDILLKIDGSVVTVSKDYMVSIANEIHLNPSIPRRDYSEKGFDHLGNDLTIARIKKEQEIKTKSIEYLKKQGCCNGEH